jgi:hypothetical protein
MKLEFNQALENFRQVLEKLCNDALAENHTTLAEIEQIKIELEPGPKFIRVVRTVIHKPTGQTQSRSAHCFIEAETGNILKASAWKAPEKKNPRGNIFNQNPLGGVTQYGVVYLR